MSWFFDNDLIGIEDTETDDEIEDGVVVERRRVLMASATAAGALILGGAAPAPRTREGAGKPLTLEQMLETALPGAREIVRSSDGNETAYLFRLASLIARLEDKKTNPGKAVKDFRSRHAVDGEARFPIGIVQMRMKPGRRLRHHDHRDYNGIIVGVEGSVRIKNYDIVGSNRVPPQGRTFQIKESQDTLVTPGRYSMLSRSEHNIHDLRAGPEGAVVFDVFTFFEKGARSYWMDVEEKPRDAEARIYDAAWRPTRRRR